MGGTRNEHLRVQLLAEDATHRRGFLGGPRRSACGRRRLANSEDKAGACVVTVQPTSFPVAEGSHIDNRRVADLNGNPRCIRAAARVYVRRGNGTGRHCPLASHRSFFFQRCLPFHGCLLFVAQWSARRLLFSRTQSFFQRGQRRARECVSSERAVFFRPPPSPPLPPSRTGSAFF